MHPTSNHIFGLVDKDWLTIVRTNTWDMNDTILDRKAMDEECLKHA